MSPGCNCKLTHLRVRGGAGADDCLGQLAHALLHGAAVRVNLALKGGLGLGNRCGDDFFKALRNEVDGEGAEAAGVRLDEAAAVCEGPGGRRGLQGDGAAVDNAPFPARSRSAHPPRASHWLRFEIALNCKSESL